MYSKQEASQLRHEFWTSFGRYMSPVLSAEGEKINWINYRTGERNISFKMDTGNRSASIAIVITHADADIRKLYFLHFMDLKKILEEQLEEEWNWVEEMVEENGMVVSKIYKDETGMSIFNKNDWPALISFFKPRMIALDAFWSNVKYGFEALR